MRKSLRREEIREVAPRLSESEFSFTLTRVAVAQICQSKGFNRAESPALEALTDIAIKYLRAVAKVSAESSNSSGRTQSNVLDIVFALEDLASIQGFPGSSTARSRSLSTSPVIKNLMKFVKYTDEIPFAQPLPPRKNLCMLKCRDSNGWYDVGRLKHVPRWLPAPAVPPVEENGSREERQREVKWGSLGVKEGKQWEDIECGEQRTVERESSNEMETLEKRGKVRFKMGAELGNGRMTGESRGVGIGKRVWCER